ncbi:MAG: hypothetical protein KDD58_01485 [Bdellovibrionales bacterium]|nr:hypothetical protein [Bdellovibrionales bacterium]
MSIHQLKKNLFFIVLTLFTWPSLANLKSYNFQDLFYFAQQSFQKNYFGSNYSPQMYSAHPYYSQLYGQNHSQANMQSYMKTWTNNEMIQVQQAFQGLLNHRELEPVFSTISRIGKVPMMRFSSYPLPKPSGVKSCKRLDSKKTGGALIWVMAMQPPMHIGVSDDYFELFNLADENSDYSTLTHSSLHELMHILDFQYRNLTQSPDFLQATGWYQVAQNEWKNRYINYDLLNKTHKKYCEDEAETLETYQELFDVIVEMGFPSMYSTSNPQEFFAEIAAVYWLNPDADKILHPDFIAYLDRLFKK